MVIHTLCVSAYLMAASAPELCPMMMVCWSHDSSSCINGIHTDSRAITGSGKLRKTQVTPEVKKTKLVNFFSRTMQHKITELSSVQDGIDLHAQKSPYAFHHISQMFPINCSVTSEMV